MRLLATFAAMATVNAFLDGKGLKKLGLGPVQIVSPFLLVFWGLT